MLGDFIKYGFNVIYSMTTDGKTGMENTFCETYPTVFSCSYNNPVKTRTDIIKVNSNDGICIYSDNILLAIILFALWMTFAIATFMQIFLIIRKSIYSTCCIAKYYLTSKLNFFLPFLPVLYTVGL